MNCIKTPKDMTLKDEPLRLVGVQYATGEEQRTTTNRSIKNEDVNDNPICRTEKKKEDTDS